MSSLFDAIKGALVLLGGMSEAERKDKALQSEDEFRKSSIDVARERTEAERESASAGRALTKELTKGGWVHQAEESAKTREHTSSENLLSRQMQAQLQDLALNAQREMMEFNALQESGRLAMKLESDEMIAKLARDLQAKGLSIEYEKLRRMAPWEVSFVMEAAKLALSGTTGIEGYASGLTQPEAAQRNVNTFNSRMDAFMKMADPTGKLGLRDLAVPLLSLVPTGYAPSGVPGRNALPITPPGVGFNKLPVDNTGVSTLTGRPLATPAQIPIHPQDEYRLNLWSSAVKSKYDPSLHPAAFDEYSQVIGSEPFAGVQGLAPEDDAAYRMRLRGLLREKLSPSFSGR